MRPFFLLPLGLLVSVVAVHAGARAERVGDTGRDSDTDTGLDTAADTALVPDDDACALTLLTDDTTGEALLSFDCGALAAATLDMLLELAPEDHLCAVDATTDTLVCGVVAGGVSGVGSPLCEWSAGVDQYICRMPLAYRPVVPGETCESFASSYGVGLSGAGSNAASSPLPVGSLMCVPTPDCHLDLCMPIKGGGPCTSNGYYTPGLGLLHPSVPPSTYTIRPGALPDRSSPR